MRDELSGALETKNDFLIRYFRMKIDLYNLKTLFRMIRMKKDEDLCTSGTGRGSAIDPAALAPLTAFEPASAIDFYGKTDYAPIAENASSLRRIEAACEAFEEGFLKGAAALIWNRTAGCLFAEKAERNQAI